MASFLCLTVDCYNSKFTPYIESSQVDTFTSPFHRKHETSLFLKSRPVRRPTVLFFVGAAPWLRLFTRPAIDTAFVADVTNVLQQEYIRGQVTVTVLWSYKFPHRTYKVRCTFLLRLGASFECGDLILPIHRAEESSIVRRGVFPK